MMIMMMPMTMILIVMMMVMKFLMMVMMTMMIVLLMVTSNIRDYKLATNCTILYKIKDWWLWLEIRRLVSPLLIVSTQYRMNRRS
jgi:hypothetical protein